MPTSPFEPSRNPYPTMEQKEELKRQARELERAEEYPAALDAYRRLATDHSGDDGAAALWNRIGDIQLRLSDTEGATQSFARAVELFSAEGLRNNALAISQKLVAADQRRAISHRSMGDLALALGYRRDAREALGAFARLAAEDGELDDALAAVAAFLTRFPDDRDLLAEVTADLIDLRGEEEAGRALEVKIQELTATGEPATTAAFREQLARLRGNGGAGSGGLEEPDLAERGADRRDAPAADSDGESLPLLDARPEADSRDIEVEPLAGFQPTHEETWGGGDTGEVAEGLRPPVPEPTPPATDEEVDDQVVDEDAAADVEPLPLLGAVEGAPADGAVHAADDPFVDLRSLVFGEEAGAEEPASAHLAREFGEDERAAVLALLRQRATGTVEPADAVTHYDLGIAFKEMSLLEEALLQLTAALAKGHDPVAALEVAGEMLVEHGEFELAGRLLRAALTAGAGGELVGVIYWLARSLEGLGRGEEAARCLARVVAIDPVFRDSAERLERLRET